MPWVYSCCRYNHVYAHAQTHTQLTMPPLASLCFTKYVVIFFWGIFFVVGFFFFPLFHLQSGHPRGQLAPLVTEQCLAVPKGLGRGK